MMKRLTCTAGLACLIALSGCASTAPSLEQQFGQTLRAALSSQVINPTASANTNPVHGIDSQAALGAQGQYVRSFATPIPHQGAMITGTAK